MRSLKEYIQEDNFEQLKLSDKLYSKLKIIYKEPIIESKGMPEGIREDSKYIAHLIRKYAVQKLKEGNWGIHIRPSILKLKCFNSLTLKVKYTEEPTNAYTSNSKLDFTITIFLNKKDLKDDLSPLICHELLHAYVDAINIRSGKSTIESRRSHIKYNEIFCTETSSDIEEITRKMMYVFIEDELNAYISQITLEIENKKPQNSDDAYLLLINNSFYKSYLYFGEILNNNSLYKDICNNYRKYSDGENSKKTDNVIIKELKHKYKYIQKRLEKIISRVCYESKWYNSTHGPDFLHFTLNNNETSQF